jgi:hypothetical protein
MFESYNKIDFIIIIILALIVSFIIGFNIIQVIDSKLSSVTINVPPNQGYPPIYLQVDKDNIKQINLNDVVSSTRSETPAQESRLENFSSLESEIKKENFGNILDYPDNYQAPHNSLIAGLHESKLGNKIVDQQTKMQLEQDPNYSTVNDLPLLVSPDTDNPNKASSTSKAYYYASRVKLVENPDSPLIQVWNQNKKDIQDIVSGCKIKEKKEIPPVNGSFDGYNAFVDLRTDSYANVTSIGKSMLTPYTSYPVPA